MQLRAVAVVLAAVVSSVTATYVPRMPLPMRLAADSPSARAPNAEADPYALPWAIVGRD